MDLVKVLQQLHEELENLDAAIHSLERLQQTTRRRGRREDWLAEIRKPAHSARKRKIVFKPQEAG